MEVFSKPDDGNPNTILDGLFYYRLFRPAAGGHPNFQPDGRLASDAQKCLGHSSTGQSQCPCYLPTLELKWHWLRGVFHSTSYLQVAPPLVTCLVS